MKIDSKFEFYVENYLYILTLKLVLGDYFCKRGYVHIFSNSGPLCDGLDSYKWGLGSHLFFEMNIFNEELLKMFLFEFIGILKKFWIKKNNFNPCRLDSKVIGRWKKKQISNFDEIRRDG